MKNSLAIAVFSLCLLAASQALAERPLTVFVSVMPQKYFVQQIGRDLVDVHVMVKPGASPATYEPKPAQMAALSGADIYFSIGVPFEQVWLKRIVSANLDMTLVPTDKGIEKRFMAGHHHHGEDQEDVHGQEHHGDDHGEDHGDEGHEDGHKARGTDPHIWLSPGLVKVQASTIAGALAEADPDNRTFYEANAAAFIKDLDALDLELKQLFENRHGLKFMVFHPSWGYFARDYGLTQVAIEIEGKDPKPAQLKALIMQARKEEIRVIFVQPQFSTKSAKMVAREINGQVVFADPLAPDWMANMWAVALKFKEALR